MRSPCLYGRSPPTANQRSSTCRRKLSPSDQGVARIHLLVQIEGWKEIAERFHRNGGTPRERICHVGLTADWIRDGQTLLIIGATGTGKSYLACAFGHQACRTGISTRYYRLSRLLDELTLARGDGSYPKLIQRLARTWLLILSMIGVSPHSPDRPDMTSSRSSTTATLDAAPSSQVRSPSSIGMVSWTMHHTMPPRHAGPRDPPQTGVGTCRRDPIQGRPLAAIRRERLP